MYEKRYERNGTTVSPEDHKVLMEKKILVAGCGGLGGYIIEMLARVGVGHITAVDPDVFDETNLNRQLLSQEDLLGFSKSTAASERVQSINSEVEISHIIDRVDENNALEMFRGHDLVVDAMDNIKGRFVMQKACEELAIPLVHGAISGWYGQVTSIFPGDRFFDKIYPDGENTVLDSKSGNPSFSPAVIAGFEVAEVVKVLLGKGEVIRNKMLFIDMLTSQFQTIEV